MSFASRGQREQLLWDAYRALHVTNPELAGKFWSLIRNDLEKERLLENLREHTDENSLRMYLKNLEADATLRIDPVSALIEAGLVRRDAVSNGEALLQKLFVEEFENYDGLLCGRLVGESLRWNAGEKKYQLQEHGNATVEAWFDVRTSAQDADTRSNVALVKDGVDRPFSTFRIAVEGYPLGFERTTFDGVGAPVGGKSKVLEFPIQPATIKKGDHEIWVNCRHHNTLVQAVCLPLKVVPKSKPTRSSRKAGG